ncbi:MAG: glycine/sarcosine/betaine reductase component B subunit [Eggerthellaceae bacterium]|nr:glycine/sarcosine/betaine reductase component B subunit [Eggerthellaceae bacterium]
MRLEQNLIYIKDVVLGDVNKVEDGVLTVDVEGLKAAVMVDDKVKDVKVDIAKPGEKVRIVPVKDVIEPRFRKDGRNGFPGVTTKYEETGNGAVNILKGAAIVTIGDMVGFQEGVIDMWGEGARWTPFSETFNIVVDITPIDGLDPHQHEVVVRLAGLRASTFVGLAAENAAIDETKVFEIGTMAEETAKYPDLPKVLYVQMNIAQGLLHDTFFYGVDLKEIIPTWFHPFEELDNAVISGNCVAACDKITTYQHQNNALTYDLYDQHGKTINFIGNIFSPELTTLDGKFRNCDYCAKLCDQLGADGVIVSEEGYGNPDSDLVMICKRLEKRGIKTALVTDECSGWDGTSQPLTDTAAEAVAVVSSGNVSKVIDLEPADKVLGNLKSAQTLAGGWDGCVEEDGSLKVELNAVIGATSEIGYHYASVKLY